MFSFWAQVGENKNINMLKLHCRLKKVKFSHEMAHKLLFVSLS